MDAHDITWLSLGIGALSLMLPVFIFAKYKTGLVKPALWAFARMTVQLMLAGIYLKYVFDINSILLNLLWVVIMIVAASASIVKRSELSNRKFFIAVAISVVINLIFNGMIFAFIILPGESFFDARYTIPIAGMIIGNSLSSAVIGLRTFYKSLAKDDERYRYALMCGATKNEALFPFITEALKSAFSPMIASTATIGLIWLPGMMTGQILAGSNPVTAIKYQIMIMLAIFVGSVITVFLSIKLSEVYAFDNYDMPVTEILPKK